MARYRNGEWVSIYETGTDYEADIIRDRLDSEGIPAVVLTQRDHAFNLTVGRMAPVQVLVPESQIEAAQHLLASEPLSDEELERIAMAADPNAKDAHDPARQTMLDTGINKIRFSSPDEDSAQANS